MIGLIDIGGTKLLAAVSTPSGSVGPVVRRATSAAGASAVLVAMLREAGAGARLDGVAVAVPGPFDRARGALLAPPNMPTAWHGLELRAELGGAFGGCPVVVENDANCAALAEAREGAGRGAGTVLYVTVSTGIGMGLVSAGALVLGRHDSEAGHQVLWPGWLGGPPCPCGSAGCLEALASGTAIHRRFGVRAEELEDLAAWADVGRWLGLGVANAVAVTDPDVVVLGGGVMAAAERFWPVLTETIAGAVRLQPVPTLRRAELGVERNLVGALALSAGRA